jgi:uncharacterized OB-fold protein
VTYDKPVPVPDRDDEPFWQATRQHVLRLPHCDRCEHTWFPPYDRCPRCLRPHGWITASGRGEVFAYTVFDRPYLRSFEPDVPYHVALVQLEEGPLIYGNVLDAALEEVAVGCKVEVVFDDVTGTITLPRFRLAAGEPPA